MTGKLLIGKLYTLFVAAALLGGSTGRAVAQQKPNIIYILADDLGYGDLGCFGSKKIKTPNLNRMASEGLRLTRHYSTGVCAPSRATLMTGKHLGHCEIRGNRQASTGYGQMPLSDTAVTVAMLLKRAGYFTATVGKWGLGEPQTSGDPLRQGFDHYFGYTDQVLAHNHFPQFLLRSGKKVMLDNDVKYVDSTAWHKGRGSYATRKKEFSQDLFTAEVLKLVSERKADRKPFFIYYTPVIPHDNGEAPAGEKIESPTMEPYTGETPGAGPAWTDDQKRYAASITYLDREVGKLLDHLKREGLDKNTLVLFVSDNGPQKRDLFESTGGLRGSKRDMYEGGIRVPFIARWPGRIKPGVVNDTPTALWDFLPTACELAGISAPRHDGISLIPLFNNKPATRRPYLYWELYDGGSKQAVLMGDWKAVRNDIKPNLPFPPVELYNLKQDPAEQTNVASAHPEIVQRMEAIMQREHTPSPVFTLAGDKITGN